MVRGNAMQTALLLALSYLSLVYADEAQTDARGRWNLRFQNVGFEINPLSTFAKMANMAGGR